MNFWNKIITWTFCLPCLLNSRQSNGFLYLEIISRMLEYFLSRLEIVFIFPRLVLQIFFQIQFGLPCQCEIYHSNKWNVVESQHYIFSRKPLTIATILCIQFYPQNRKLLCYCVIEIFSNSYNYYMLSGMFFKICKFKKFCRADERKNLLFHYCLLNFVPNNIFF